MAIEQIKNAMTAGAAGNGKSPYPDKSPEGYKKYGWQTQGHVIMSSPTDCPCVDVSPEFPIKACSFLVVPMDTGVARQMTADDILNPVAKCNAYFTTCEICPRTCRQAWVYKGLSVNGNLVCLPEGVTQRQAKNFLYAAGAIKLLFPTMV